MVDWFFILILAFGIYAYINIISELSAIAGALEGIEESLEKHLSKLTIENKE